MKKAEYDCRVVLSKEQCINGISEVMLDEKSRLTNLEIARDILRKIEEVSEDGSIEIVFANDIRKYIEILQQEGLSPLVIDSAFRIRLPLYELTLDLPPLAKSIYMLYMRHEEGFYRKQIADFRDELLLLYAANLKKRVDREMCETIDHLTDFSRKNLDKQMSIINSTFRCALKDKAVHYIPQSEHRGGIRKLDFERVSFHLPKSLQDDNLLQQSAERYYDCSMKEFRKIEVKNRVEKGRNETGTN